MIISASSSSMQSISTALSANEDLEVQGVKVAQAHTNACGGART